MGQSPHKTSHANNNWEPMGNSGRFQIFKNQNNQLAEKHVVPNHPKLSEADELAAYYERYLPNRPIVNAYSAEFQSSKKGFCSHSQNITAFIQYIPHRLTDIKRLSNGQGMYVLSESLAGFSYLHQKFGSFPVSQDLIGFNKDGQVKVWNNPNFAQNHLDNDMVVLMSTINPYDFDNKFSKQQEYDMVEDTFNAVSRHSNFSQQFLQRGLHMQKLGFPQARALVAQQIDRKAYYVPDHLNLSDKNGILQRSGIQPKYRSSNINHQMNHNQHHGINNVNGSSQNDVQIQYRGNGNNNGTYNLNGQNYRIISTKLVDQGSSQCQEQVVRRALGGEQAYYQSQDDQSENVEYQNHNANHNANQYQNYNQNIHNPNPNHTQYYAQQVHNQNQANVIYVNDQNKVNHHQPYIINQNNNNTSTIIPTSNMHFVHQNSRVNSPVQQQLRYNQNNDRTTYQSVQTRVSPYDPNFRGTYQTSSAKNKNIQPNTITSQPSIMIPNRTLQANNYLNDNIEELRSPIRHKTIFDSHYRATRGPNNQLANQ